MITEIEMKEEEKVISDKLEKNNVNIKISESNRQNFRQPEYFLKDNNWIKK